MFEGGSLAYRRCEDEKGESGDRGRRHRILRTVESWEWSKTLIRTRCWVRLQCGNQDVDDFAEEKNQQVCALISMNDGLLQKMEEPSNMTFSASSRLRWQCHQEWQYEV